VLYLGELYPGADPPWHYSLVLLLVSTPLLLLTCAVASAGRVRSPQSGPLVGLALVWLATLLVADLFASARYDGVRHLLPALPAIALLAAVGLQTIWDAAAGARPAVRAAVGTAMAVGALAWAADLVRMHPYHDAYLNGAARLVSGDAPERWTELEIWGASYKEGAAWLAANAEPGATVVVPIAPHCARPYLDNVVKRVPPERGDAPVYLMFMTRVAKYKDVIRRAEAQLEPVFAIRRGDATLLEIYRLDDAWQG
jgi:hypothetical protein